MMELLAKVKLAIADLEIELMDVKNLISELNLPGQIELLEKIKTTHSEIFTRLAFLPYAIQEASTTLPYEKKTKIHRLLSARVNSVAEEVLNTLKETTPSRSLQMATRRVFEESIQRVEESARGKLF